MGETSLRCGRLKQLRSWPFTFFLWLMQVFGGLAGRFSIYLKAMNFLAIYWSNKH